MTLETSTRVIFKMIVELKDNEYIKIYDHEISRYPHNLTTYELTKRADRSSLENLFQKIHVRSRHDIRDDSLSLEEWKNVKTKIASWHQRRYEKLAWWKKFAEWLTSFFAVSKVELSYKLLIADLDLRVARIEEKIQETEEGISQWNTCWEQEKKATPEGLEALYELFQGNLYRQPKEAIEATVNRLIGFKEFMDEQVCWSRYYGSSAKDKIERFLSYVEAKLKYREAADDEFWSDVAVEINSKIAEYKEEKKIKDLVIDLSGIYSSRTLSTNEMKEKLEEYELYKSHKHFIENKTEKVQELELQIEVLKKSQEKMKNLLSGEQSEQSKKEIAAELEKGLLKYPVLFDLVWKEEGLQSLFSKDLALKSGVEKKLWRLMWVYCLYNPDFDSGMPRAFCDIMGLGGYSSDQLKEFFEKVKNYASECRSILKQKKYEEDNGKTMSLYCNLFKTIDAFKQKFPKVEIENFLGVDKLMQRLDKVLKINMGKWIKDVRYLRDFPGEFGKKWKEPAVRKGVKECRKQIANCKEMVKTGVLTPEGVKACYSLFDLKMSTKHSFVSPAKKDIREIISWDTCGLEWDLMTMLYYKNEDDLVRDINQREKIHESKNKEEFWKQLSKDLTEEIAQKEFDRLVLLLKDFDSRHPQHLQSTKDLINLFKKYENNTPPDRTPLLEDEALKSLVIAVQKEVKHLDDLKKDIKELVDKILNEENSEKASLKKDLIEKASQAFLLCPHLAKSLWESDCIGRLEDEGLEKETAKAVMEILKKLAIELYEKSQKKEEVSALQLQLQLAFNALYNAFLNAIPHDFYLPYWSVGLKFKGLTYYITKINPEEWKDKSDAIYKFFDKNFKQEKEKLIEISCESDVILDFLKGKGSLELKNFSYFISDIVSACKIVEMSQCLCIPKEAMKLFYEQFEKNEGWGIEWTTDGGISLNCFGQWRYAVANLLSSDFVDLMKSSFIQRNLKDLTLNIPLDNINIKKLALALSSCENLRNLTASGLETLHREFVEEIAELIEKYKDEVFPSLNAIISGDTESLFKGDVKKQLKKDRPELLLLKDKKE